MPFVYIFQQPLTEAQQKNLQPVRDPDKKTYNPGIFIYLSLRFTTDFLSYAIKREEESPFLATACSYACLSFRTVTNEMSVRNLIFFCHPEPCPVPPMCLALLILATIVPWPRFSPASCNRHTPTGANAGLQLHGDCVWRRCVSGCSLQYECSMATTTRR